MILADRIAWFLAEEGAHTSTEIARGLHVRRIDVQAALDADPRFALTLPGRRPQGTKLWVVLAPPKPQDKPGRTEVAA